MYFTTSWLHSGGSIEASRFASQPGRIGVNGALIATYPLNAPETVSRLRFYVDVSVAGSAMGDDNPIAGTARGDASKSQTL
jgi:hypothetical protein